MMEGICDDGLDILDDDLNEILNVLGDVDIDLDDLEDELLGRDRLHTDPVRYGLAGLLSKYDIYLTNYFMDNSGQPSLFNDDFEEKVEADNPLIAEA